MKRTGAVLALLLALFVTAPAFGAVVIDFSTGLAGVSGTFSLNGTNATGSNIAIGALTVSGANTGNGVWTVSGSCGGFGCLNFNTVANTISITGAVAGLGVASQALLTGQFSVFTADVDGLHGARGPDAKAADLLTAVGLPTNFQFSFFGFSLTTNTLVSNPGSGSVISTDIRNTGVPEPASIVLFGTVLLITGSVLRRRQSAQK